MLFAAGAFANEGLDVCVCGFDIDVSEYGALRCENTLSEAIIDADYIILPLPYSTDGERVNAPFCLDGISVSDVEMLCKNSIVIGGKMDKKLGLRTIDYYAREDFAVLNALPTAEGTIKLVIEQTKSTMRDLDIAVLGFGRIGKVLAKTLVSMGAHVTVYARSAEARAWAKVFFCTAYTFDELKEHISKHSCIFNTVPTHILTEDVLLRACRGTLFTELASAPYGADENTVKNAGLRYLLASALPGRITPKSAGRIIYETLKEIIMEEEK